MEVRLQLALGSTGRFDSCPLRLRLLLLNNTTNQGETKMKTYTIQTDADQMTTEATSFNDAAKQFDESIDSADELIEKSERAGGYCWIENDETGERVGRRIR